MIAKRGRAVMLAAALAVAASAPAAQADGDHGPVGLGVILGEPTGVSLKIWLDGRNAFAGAAAWSFADEAALHIHGDYLWHFFNRVDIDPGRLPLYIGVGGRIKTADKDDLVGVRVPFGATYILDDAPVDIFLELVPLMDIAPDTEFRLNAAVGARFYFN
ncbi:MAG: hypothetical protein HKN12_06550 [Gemmatimonadetes bacterium]|nr:hypothetical protein [Gemmatimonadota bacterium]